MAGGHAAGLTKRQREVWELLRQGLTNDEIASQLGISPDGVKYHVADILRRLQVRSRYEAALIEPRAARRSWARALVPLPLLGKLKSHTLAYAASGAALAAVAAGIALLAWGVMRTHGDSAPLAGDPTPAHRQQQVSFVRDGAIWLVSPDRGAPQRFADLAPCGDFFPNVAWSPDGQHLACYGAAPNTTGKIEPETLHIVVWDSAGKLLRQLDSGPTSVFSLAWSPSGASFEYATDDAISFVGADGQPRGQIAGAAIDPAYYAADISLGSPLWSQDGTKFAYWLNSDGHAHVITPRANGAGDRPLLDLGGRPMAWVLNDTAMLVAENYQPAAAGSLAFPSYQVSLVDLATGTRQRRPELDNGVQFWLSPDRTRLAYLAPGLSMGLMDIARGTVTPVPNSLVTYPSEGIPTDAVRFTPDGSAVYWTNYDNGSTAWRANFETGALDKVLDAGGSMALAPDASRLLVLAKSGADQTDVKVRDLPSGAERTILTYTNSALPAGTPFDPAAPRDFDWRPGTPEVAPPPTSATPNAPSDAAGDWQIVDYAFTSTDDGWVVRSRALQQAGTPMQVLSTTDGGRTWASQYASSSFVPWSIDSVDADHAWIAGATGCRTSGNVGAAGCSGAVLSTSDGGATWRASTVPSVPFLTSVDFFDANTGWAGNARYIDQCLSDASVARACPEPRTVQRTTDGGATWTTVYDQHYMQMVPLDATRALVVTADTTLLVTPDGSTQQGASPCADTPDLGPMLADGVTTLDGTAWLTCGTLGAAAAPAELYRSSDAGATWALVAGATSLPCDGDVQFVDSTHGWCASRAGALFATSDGGGTWSDNNGVLVAPVADVQFIDQQHGWVSNLQQLAATMDGGARWAQVQLPGDAAAPAGTPGATRSYTNEQYGYSFEYPATYFDLGESRDLPAPLLDDKYFATANTSNPLELGLSDLWLTIRVVDNAQRESLESWAASHLNSPSDPDPPSVKRIVVGGRPAIQQIEDAMTGPHEPSYSVVTYVDEGDLVLCINGMGLAKSGFDAHAAEYQAMVAGMHLFTPATTDEPLGDGTSVSATAQAP